MKIILKIAKNELRHLFFSPIAWFLSIIFLVMCAYFYTGMMYPMAKATYSMYKNYPQFIYWATESLTRAIFWEPQTGFFPQILPHIYLFVPLLTMGIISREFTSGTSRLLYSSPVKLRQIIFGKYLAIALYNLVLVSIIGIFILSGAFDIKSLDIGPLLSALLGFYLLLCAMTAIGFFMSSLSHYQIIAAIASFTVLFVLSYIGNLWQDYDFIRDLTYFLSIANRTEKMLVGLITTKDIIYYLVIIFLFVSFTLIKLNAGREKKPWYMLTARYLGVVVMGLMIGYISSRPRFTGYWDTSARKVHTIHPRTQQILRDLGDSPLEVTLYTNLLGAGAGQGFPNRRNAYITDLWERYQRFKTNINFRYEYYYAIQKNDTAIFKNFPGKTLQQIAGLLAKTYRIDSSLFMSPEEMRKKIDLEPEAYRLVMQLKYKGRTTFLRATFDEGFWPMEHNVAAALKRLQQAHIPKVYFVTGGLERNIYKAGEREYYYHTLAKWKQWSLINIGFDPDTLNPDVQAIPPDASTVVLSDPKINLSDTALNRLRNYINNGGNMLILGEPGKQDVVNPLLDHLGFQLMKGQQVQPTFDETPDKVNSYITLAGLNLAEDEGFLKEKYLWANKVFDDSLRFVMPGVTAIAATGDSPSVFKAEPLLITAPNRGWQKARMMVVDSAAPFFDPQEGDVQERSFPVGMQLTRRVNGREQRIVIGGDADFASNMRLIRDYTLALYSWLNNNEFPVYTPVPYAKDNKILLTPTIASAQKIAYVWVLPGVLLLAGTVLLIRRKRR